MEPWLPCRVCCPSRPLAFCSQNRYFWPPADAQNCSEITPIFFSWNAATYGTRSPHKNIRASGRIIFLLSRTPRTRASAENQANQQCHFKSSRCYIELLGTDSCRVIVSMELPVPNSSIQHPDPDSDFDDMRIILKGASCTIRARYMYYI
jgi:hypothetical protein